MVVKMEKLIRQIRSSGSLRKGCGEQAGHLMLREMLRCLLSVMLSASGARKPKHPSGHPLVQWGSNFSSTPQGGFVKRCLNQVSNTIGGKKYINSIWRTVKGNFLHIEGLFRQRLVWFNPELFPERPFYALH